MSVAPRSNLLARKVLSESKVENNFLIFSEQCSSLGQRRVLNNICGGVRLY